MGFSMARHSRMGVAAHSDTRFPGGDMEDRLHEDTWSEGRLGRGRAMLGPI